MIDSNANGTADVGWTVGTGARAWHYNGTTWASANGGLQNATYNGVSDMSTSEAWAVGNGGRIFKWSGGASWASQPSGTTQNLNAVSMLDTTEAVQRMTVGL